MTSDDRPDPDGDETRKAEGGGAADEGGTTEGPQDGGARAADAPSDGRAEQASGRGSSAPRPKRPNPRHGEASEKDINSPDLRTIGLLGAIFLVTAASWGSARFACNYHPPQSRPAPPATTQRLAATPKDAAIEITHRWKTRDYEGALELAKGPVAEKLQKELVQCEAEGAKCVNDRRRLQQTVLTTGVVKEKSDGTAVALVTSQVQDARERYEIRVEQDGPIWRAVALKKL